MCAQKSINQGFKIVKPMLSLDKCEAHRRVIGLYRAVYRYIPYITRYYDISYSNEDVRLKIRELFYKQAHVEDIRVIDTLVIKGYIDLKEITHNWQQKGHITANWQPTLEYKSKDFVCKFLESSDP